MHRVLLVAEACNPEWVSVPLVGWSLADALRRRTDAHLVTQVRNAAALERAGLVPGRDFTALDTERIAGPVWRLGERLRGGAGKGWTTVTALSSLLNYEFERQVWTRFGRDIRQGRFDVVHRVTPVSPTVPSPLATRCRRAGVPLVAGPWNGGVPWPKGFDAARRREKEWLSYLRGAYKLLPGYRATRRDSAALLVGSRDTWMLEPPEARRKAFYLPENAVDPTKFPPRPPRQPTLPVRAAFVGRLVPYKGADMLLAAAAELVRAGKLHLTVIGDGPQRADLEATAAGLGRGVELAGWVAHDQVGRRLAEADVFTFPSVREFGGGVVLEAMAAGLPPVVVGYGGPGELVTPATGWAVPVGPRDAIVRDLRAVLERVVANPGVVPAKGAAAAARVARHFTWAAKAGQVLRVYDWVLGRGPRPHFPMPTPDEAG